MLQKALETYGCEVTPLRKQEVEQLLKNDMDNLNAFIFNSSTHWFAIRKIDGVWFNLNSTNPGPGPQFISDFYLRYNTITLIIIIIIIQLNQCIYKRHTRFWLY